MSTARKDGGPAFPVFSPDMNVAPYAGPGMTLRDWFAGQALMGALAFPGVVNGSRDKSAKSVVSAAYLYADAMIAERSK